MKTVLKTENLTPLVHHASQIRIAIIEMLLAAGSGHSAGPLGMADVLTALYFVCLNIDPERPHWAGRDRLYLSCGHIAPVLYATLAERGFFPKKELKTLRQFGSRLQGHPHIQSLPGVENTSGPLGQGLSQAIGAALAARLLDQKQQIFCILSDGEHDEGQTYEAMLYAGAHKLDNLIALVDRNNIQIDGPTEKVLPLEPFDQKYQAFGWQVYEVDGHNLAEIITAVAAAREQTKGPAVIICHTVPGKGVDFMENDYRWHGQPPNAEQAKLALRELRSLGGRIQESEA